MAPQSADRVLNFIAGTARNNSSRWNRLITVDHEAHRNRRANDIRHDIRAGASQALEQAGSVWNDATAAQQRALDLVTKTAEETAARISAGHLDSEAQAALQDAAAELRRRLHA